MSSYITVRCRYNAVSFLPNTHKIHPIARPSGRGMGCILWVQTLDLYFASVTAVMYAIHVSCYIEPRYNGIGLYIVGLAQDCSNSNVSAMELLLSWLSY